MKIRAVNFNILKQPVVLQNQTNKTRLQNFLSGDSVSFRKTYIEPVPVRKIEQRITDLNFVEYNTNDREDHKKIESLSKDWNTQYIQNIKEGFEESKEIIAEMSDIQTELHFYALEDKNGDTQIIAQVIEFSGIIEGTFENGMGIINIQANPKQLYTSKDKQYLGLGEALVSKIVKIAKAKNKDYINVISANNNFWDSSGFFKNTNPNSINSFDRNLSKADFDNYIEYVRQKTY